MSEGEITNFSPGAQQVLASARNEASRLNHNFLGSGHLLLGLLDVEHGMAVKVLKTLGVDANAIRQATERQIALKPDQAVSGIFPYTPRVKKIFALAIEEARGLGAHLVDTEHLLLGLLRKDDREAGKVLRDFKVDLMLARQEILNAGGPQSPAPAKISLGRVQAYFDSMVAEVRELGTNADVRWVFTRHTLRAFVKTSMVADRFNRNFVDTEHLLLGLIQLRGGGAITILKTMGLHLETLCRELEVFVASVPHEKELGTLANTSRVREVISLAREEAKNLNRTRIGSEHLLLGLLREGNGVAAKVLRKLNVDSEQVRQMVLSGGGAFSDQLPTDKSIGKAERKAADAPEKVEKGITLETANFTPRARQVLALAREEAGRFNYNILGTEQVLLGLIKLGQGGAVNVLKKSGLDLEIVRLEVEKQVGSSPVQKVIGNTPYTPRVKKVLALAQQEAKNLNHTYVGTEHLLLGLLRERNGVAGKVLRSLSLDVEHARLEILKELDPNFVEQASGDKPGEETDEAAARLPIAETDRINAALETLNLTPHARQAIVLAWKEANHRKQVYVDSDHLLLGLIRLERGTAANLLNKMGLDLKTVGSEIEKQIYPGSINTSVEGVPFTNALKAVIVIALDGAKRLNEKYIGTGHLLLGLLEENEGVATKVLRSFNLDSGNVRETILKDLASKSRRAGAPGSGD